MAPPPELLDTPPLLAYGARRATARAILQEPGGGVQQTVTYAVADGVGWVTLNRPAVLNALDNQLASDLADAAEAAAADPAVLAVVVRGAGRAFCAGMDRTALAAGRIGAAFYRHWIRALNTLEDMDKLAVCVLHGHSIGGGLQLALACDVRIATEDAVIGLGATRHGLIPDGGVLRLARPGSSRGPRGGRPDERPGGRVRVPPRARALLRPRPAGHGPAHRDPRRGHDLHGHGLHHLREPDRARVRRRPEPGGPGVAVRADALRDVSDRGPPDD